MDWDRREIRLGELSFPYYLGSNCIDRIAWELAHRAPDRILLVSDETVLGLHGRVLIEELERYVAVHAFAFPPGENMKSVRRLGELLEAMLSAGATHSSMVVAFGGGVPGNLAGLAAALLFRGVRLAHVPTTPLAATDSVISIKQAVNSSRGKNQVGTYHRPEAVLLDIELLRTVPERELRGAWCEDLKNCLAIRPAGLPDIRRFLSEGALASDEGLFWLLDNALECKRAVSRTDSRERGPGLVLEYGHTVGHAIEHIDGAARGKDALSHGEAVAVGMRAAARISEAMGGLSADEVAIHDELIGQLGVTSELPPEVALDAIIRVVAADNKRGYVRVGPGEIPMVLLRQLGAPFTQGKHPLVPVSLDLVSDVVDRLLSGSGLPANA